MNFSEELIERLKSIQVTLASGNAISETDRMVLLMTQLMEEEKNERKNNSGS